MYPNTTHRPATAVGIALATASLAVLVLAGSAAAGHWDDGGNFDDGEIRDPPDGEDLLADGADQAIYPPEEHRTSRLRFGTAVDANGGADTIGHTSAASGPHPDNPKVFVYKNTGTDEWNFSAAIDVDVGDTEQAVSVDGDTLVVALDEGAGIAVYQRSSGDWTRTTTLDRLARNVEVSGDTLTYGTGSPENDYGIYERQSTGDWTEVVREEQSDCSCLDYGSAVGVQEGSPSLAVFGTAKQSPGNTGGVAQVWEDDPLMGWYQREWIETCGPLDQPCFGSFGEALDLAPTSEKKVAVGNPAFDDDSGRAYTYLNDGATYEWSANLTGHDDSPSKLGADVNAWDGSSVAGAPGFDLGPSREDTGHVHAYESGVGKGYIEQANEEDKDKFGSAVHYTGKWTLAGAPREDFDGYTDLGYVGYFK